MAPAQHSRSRAGGQRWLVTPLVGLVLASAFAVIHASHACRELHTQLQRLEVEQWALQEDHGRLLLEQSTWASHYRVERTALRELDMQSPAPEQIRVVGQ